MDYGVLAVLYAKNEAAQLKIRIEIKSEKEDSGISIIITTTKKTQRKPMCRVVYGILLERSHNSPVKTCIKYCVRHFPARWLRSSMYLDYRAPYLPHINRLGNGRIWRHLLNQRI